MINKRDAFLTAVMNGRGSENQIAFIDESAGTLLKASSRIAGATPIVFGMKFVE